MAVFTLAEGLAVRVMMRKRSALEQPGSAATEPHYWRRHGIVFPEAAPGYPYGDPVTLTYDATPDADGDVTLAQLTAIINDPMLVIEADAAINICYRIAQLRAAGTLQTPHALITIPSELDELDIGVGDAWPGLHLWDMSNASLKAILAEHIDNTSAVTVLHAAADAASVDYTTPDPDLTPVEIFEALFVGDDVAAPLGLGGSTSRGSWAA